tara:strand:- start:27405 stop:27704 length:300 start_codon:yes stop_codon:yes gene_type:complete
MPIANQKYALVTVGGWERSLSERWPDAPTFGGYKLLVFAGSDLAPIEAEYSEADFKYLSTSETIEQMEQGIIGPFICNINQAREIVAHFTPVEDEQNAV